MADTPDEQRAIAEAATLVARIVRMANGLRGSMWANRNETIRLFDEAADRLAALEAERAAGEARVVALETILRSVAGNMLNIQIGLDTGDTKATAAKRLCETVNVARAALAKREPGS